MDLVVISKEELEDLVQTSVNKAVTEYFENKEAKEKFKEIMSVKETSKLLGVSELTVRNHIIQGLYKAERVGRRIYIRRKNLDLAMQEVKSLKYKR